jgi:hypothetical protein
MACITPQNAPYRIYRMIHLKPCQNRKYCRLYLAEHKNTIIKHVVASFVVLNTDIFTLFPYIHIKFNAVFQNDHSVYSYMHRIRQKNLTCFKSRYFGNHVGWGSEAKVSGHFVLWMWVTVAQRNAQHHRFVDEVHIAKGDSVFTTRLFLTHFNMPRHGSVPGHHMTCLCRHRRGGGITPTDSQPRRHILKVWEPNASAVQRKHRGRTYEIRTPENTEKLRIAIGRQMRTQNFSWSGGGGADPDAIHNLFEFKNYIIKIM